MASIKFYILIIIRIVLIAVLTFFIAFTLLKDFKLLAGLLLIFLIFQIVFLIRYLNRTNIKIAYFFDSLVNEDFTIRFPEDANPKSLMQLHTSINKVKNLIRETQIKNRLQENYYQEILKQAKIGILMLNDKGHVIFANPTIKKILNSNQLNHLRQLEKVDSNLFNLLSNLQPFERKLYQLTSERETNHLVIRATQVVLDNNVLKLITIQEINNELDEKETDSWTKLIRVLTHEIMNTIAPISSISESILNYYKGEDGLLSLNEISEVQIKNTVEGLEIIKNQGNDLVSFVQAYRNLLSIPVPDKKIIEVPKLLKKIKVLANQDKVFDSILFEVNNTIENLEIFADEKQITQVLVNLSKNAIQSLHDMKGGCIEFKSGINSHNEKYISVNDNGPGISLELIDQIFVPFFTTKTDGSGIGLSLSKQIMKMHGGSLKVHSQPSLKTSFSLYFLNT
jgi:two-component system nitrogen regulation sensor histidine kinase NtrY